MVNTNICTALALLTWLLMDMWFSKSKKPTLLGAINGMIVGLVTITPAAGYVNGGGAIALGVITSVIVWLAWYKLSKVWIFAKVDDALGVVYTHGIAGLTGGLLVGIFADPNMTVYYGGKGTSNFGVTGLLYGNHSFHQLLMQLGAAVTVIVWTGVMTFVILKVVGLFIKLRLPDDVLETGDLAVHDEEVYPDEGLTAVGAVAEVTAAAAATAEYESTPPVVSAESEAAAPVVSAEVDLPATD